MKYELESKYLARGGLRIYGRVPLLNIRVTFTHAEMVSMNITAALIYSTCVCLCRAAACVERDLLAEGAISIQ